VVAPTSPGTKRKSDYSKQVDVIVAAQLQEEETEKIMQELAKRSKDLLEAVHQCQWTPDKKKAELQQLNNFLKITTTSMMKVTEKFASPEGK
jgi:hypothetical protein